MEQLPVILCLPNGVSESHHQHQGWAHINVGSLAKAKSADTKLRLLRKCNVKQEACNPHSQVGEKALGRAIDLGDGQSWCHPDSTRSQLKAKRVGGAGRNFVEQL